MRKGLAFIFLSALVFLAPVVADAQEALRLGIHPYLSPSKIIDRFTPLADYLSMELGRPVSVNVSKDYAEHIERVGEGRVDIAFMGPASYVKLVNSFGFHPLLARLEVYGKPVFHGVIIALKESPLEKLTDLKGKRFAFGDPNSTMSHLLPRFMLIESGVKIVDLEGYGFLSSHDNVALGVLMGDYDAGAVKEEVYFRYERRGLKALKRTPEISEHIFVCSNMLSGKTVDAVREAMLKLKDHDGGKFILSSINEGATGLVPVSDSDYDNLREVLSVLNEAEEEP